MNSGQRTIIVGLNAFHADASAAIFVDGKLIAAIEEERFTRAKHWAGFPKQAIDFCLKEAGVSAGDVDHWAIGRDPGAKKFKKLLYLLRNPSGSLNAVKQRLQNRLDVVGFQHILETSLTGHAKRMSLHAKFHNIEHHRSHLASAFFASPFESAACISIDGSGDFSTTMTAVGDGNKLKVIRSLDFPHSLGIFYTAFTQFLGFPHYGDEYKVMGMAPYGKPVYAQDVSKLIRFTDDGLFRLNLPYFREGTQGIISYDENYIPVVAQLFSEKFKEIFGAPRAAGEELTQRHKDLAASVQYVTEQTIFHLLRHLQRTTGRKKLCLAGGVAQNSVANGKITRETGFEEVYIPSAGHDAGISMGAALYVQHQLLDIPRSYIKSAYTGSHYSDEEISAACEKANVKFERLSDEELIDQSTNQLINGAVIGWFQGRAEFGPRALGARSIIADPRRTDAKELLNTKIKRRESFRPFAPSILEDHVAAFFDCNEPVPFMEKVFPVRADKRALIPAVTHVDGSGRLQTVNAEISPRYYALIDAFHKKTGIPILLNTSFNENEPIVNSPAEAIACFLRTDMDILVMENIMVRR